jgi:hypothetical protein
MTEMTPLALFFLILMGILLIALPRKYALVPLFISALYMTLGQRLVVMGFNFMIFRILIVIGFIRILFRRDISPIQFNSLDKIILIWSIVVIVTGFLLDINTNKFDNLQHRSGQIFSALGMYYIFRLYTVSIDDIMRVIRIFAIIMVPLAGAFLLERATGKNMFSIFGGVSEFTMIRYDRFRCQGPFAHPILAGTLGATIMPLFVSFWFKKGKQKLIGLMGIISSIIIVITSASSGPLLAWIAVLIALFMWPLRDRMRIIRWGIFLGLITLHMLMKAPVWYLIGRISEITGGTGWGRSELIDIAISHFNEWWLIGTIKTSHWDPVGILPNEDMMDITNQYILEGVYGGLARMLLFVTIIVNGFSRIGKAMKVLKDENFTIKFLPWTLGASLFAHAVGFLSVAYFDQLIVIWYLLLAMISAISNMSSTVPVKTAAA